MGVFGIACRSVIDPHGARHYVPVRAQEVPEASEWRQRLAWGLERVPSRTRAPLRVHTSDTVVAQSDLERARVGSLQHRNQVIRKMLGQDPKGDNGPFEGGPYPSGLLAGAWDTPVAPWLRPSGPAISDTIHTPRPAVLVALFRSGAQLRATAIRCPHQGQNLLDGGELEDIEELGRPILRCPRHNHRFDLFGGAAVAEAPCIGGGPGLALLPLRVDESGFVFLKVAEAAGVAARPGAPLRAVVGDSEDAEMSATAEEQEEGDSAPAAKQRRLMRFETAP